MKILDMKSKIIEEIYSIIAEKVKGDIEDKVIDFREEKFIEDVLQDVDERIKESVENEEVRDWILKNYGHFIKMIRPERVTGTISVRMSVSGNYRNLQTNTST